MQKPDVLVHRDVEKAIWSDESSIVMKFWMLDSYNKGIWWFWCIMGGILLTSLEERVSADHYKIVLSEQVSWHKGSLNCLVEGVANPSQPSGASIGSFQLTCAILHHHQSTKWGNTFRKNGVHSSCRVPQTWRINTKERWSYSDGTW